MNRRERERRLANDLALFMRQYQRPRHPRHDPNDRHYDYRIQELCRRLDPEELDALLRGDLDDGQPADDDEGQAESRAG